MTDRPPFAFSGPAEIIAHRGYSARAPENTLTALSLGVEAGADAVEFDLHLSADGIPFLLHDDTLDRTTDASGPIHRRRAAELGDIDAGGWFDPAFAGEPLPTLESALALVGPEGPRVYAEVKRGADESEVERIVDEVRGAGMLERTVLISMDWAALDAARVAAPEALVGYIVDRRRRAKDAIARASGDPRALLDFDARILLRHPELARRATEAGIELACWTVDEPEDATALLAMGVPRITTNRVGDLVAWKESL